MKDTSILILKIILKGGVRVLRAAMLWVFF